MARYPNNLYKLNNTEFQNKITEIQETLNTNPQIGISFRHENYQIAKQYFPKKTKYVWTLVRIINPYFFKTREILNDATIKIMLVNFKTI